MPMPERGPRLYFDERRQSWVIREGRRFIRTGASGWKQAKERFAEYMRDDPLERRTRALEASKPVQGYVYFLTAERADFPIKIGFTQRKGVGRSKDLQTGCPYPVRVLAYIPGTYADERKLHRQFAAQRLEGEWFERSDELLALIDNGGTP